MGSCRAGEQTGKRAQPCSAFCQIGHACPETRIIKTIVRKHDRSSQKEPLILFQRAGLIAKLQQRFTYGRTDRVHEARKV